MNVTNDSGSPPQRLLTKRELANTLRYSTRWVELRQRMGLPHKRIGGHCRYDLGEVMAWFETQTAGE